MPRNVFRRRATRERSEPGVTALRATVGFLEDDGVQAFFNGSIAIPEPRAFGLAVGAVPAPFR